MNLEETDYNDLGLQNLAEALYHEFVRQAVARKRNFPRQMDRPIWLRAAKLAKRLKATPENFVTSQFEGAKGHLFINALSGPSAEYRYNNWYRYKTNAYAREYDETQKDMPVTHGVDIDLMDLQGRIMSTYDSLDYYCGGTNLTDPVIARKALDIKLHWDPIIMMLLNPTPTFKEAFGERAKQQLDDSPGLRSAIQKLGFEMVLEYLDEDGEEVQP